MTQVQRGRQRFLLKRVLHEIRLEEALGKRRYRKGWNVVFDFERARCSYEYLTHKYRRRMQYELNFRRMQEE